MKLYVYVLMFSFVLFLISCQKAETPPPAEELKIIFSGSMNYDGDDTDGFSIKMSHLYQLRPSESNSLMFNTGGILSPLVNTDKNHSDVAFNSLLLIYNELNITAVNIVEDDLQLGEESLSFLKESKDIRFLSANIFNNQTNKRLSFTPFIVKTIGSIKIGIFGLTHNTGNYPPSFEIRDSFKAVKSMIKILTKISDLVVALSSQSFESDSTFTDSIRGIDFILGDYGNIRPSGPQLVGTTIIYNSGGAGNGIAELGISIRDKNLGLTDITSQNTTLKVLQQQIDDYKLNDAKSVEDLKSKKRQIIDRIGNLTNTVSFSVAEISNKVSTSEKIDLLLKELEILHSIDE